MNPIQVFKGGVRSDPVIVGTALTLVASFTVKGCEKFRASLFNQGSAALTSLRVDYAGTADGPAIPALGSNCTNVEQLSSNGSPGDGVEASTQGVGNLPAGGSGFFTIALNAVVYRLDVYATAAANTTIVMEAAGFRPARA